MWINVYDYHVSEKKYQQNYSARQASLNIFELLEDISQHMGIKKHFAVFSREKAFEEEAINFRKSFNQLRNERAEYFKDIRDFTVAHRDHNL